MSTAGFPLRSFFRFSLYATYPTSGPFIPAGIADYDFHSCRCVFAAMLDGEAVERA
jgi:hypothetical protein